MHSAPSVNFPVGRSRVAGRGLWLLWCGGAASAMAASLAGHVLGWRTLVLISTVLCAGAVLRRFLVDRAVSIRELLHFDGHGWSLSRATAFGEGRVEVCLDFQVLMLLNLSEPGCSRRWMWLERAADPQRWQDLRRAVYSRAPMAGQDTSAAISPTLGASSSLS